jgi:hypothetical protein
MRAAVRQSCLLDEHDRPKRPSPIARCDTVSSSQPSTLQVDPDRMGALIRKLGITQD